MNKKKILVVDDEEDLLKIMESRIESWGYEVLFASNGKDAIEVVKNKSPDIIILDYKMSDMDGVSTLREIRKIDSKIPSIMFTAYPDERSIKGSEDMGVTAFIPKLSAYSNSNLALRTAIDMAVKGLSKEMNSE